MKANFHVILLISYFLSSCASKQPTATVESKLLGDGLGISGAAILVKDLDSSRNYYKNVLGFNMPEKFEKGTYEGTQTAFVNFPDMSGFHLVGIKDTAIVRKKNSFITTFLKQFEGVRIYSLSTSSVDSTAGWLSRQGYKIDSPMQGRFSTSKPKGWDWDDGEAQWRSVSFNPHDPPSHLPHFFEITGLPYSETRGEWKPYTMRRYYEDHPNGVVGISGLRIMVSDLQAARKEFKKIGFKELEASDSTVTFNVAYNHRLHLLSSKFPGDEADKFLKSRGQAVYAICFEIKSFKETHEFLKRTLPAKALLTDSIAKSITVKKEYAHGVQLEFMEESKEQAAMAKIYSFKDGEKLDSTATIHASKIYAKYCALCHGKDREGYAADFAPSLRSHSLMATTRQPASSHNFLKYTVLYGRSGTAMAPYGKGQGGPLDYAEIELLLQWLYESSGVKKPIEIAPKPITGNIGMGKKLYEKYCASCHGSKGEGVRGPALAHPMLLATASDAFLHYTISKGRDSTPMPAFKDSLGKIEINALTAFIRSRASGWNTPASISVSKPLPKDYVLNPGNSAPEFTLREGLYVPAVQVQKAIKDSARMIILDARSEAAWHQTHIPGAVSVPYYKEPEKFIRDIPNDSTFIVVYCACPHAASTQVVNTLRRLGYKHTAILDEGILVWAQRGYPVQYGIQGKGKK